MANGSRRTTPCCPAAAAVVSEPMVAAMYTPSTQLRASVTSGTVVERRPPKMKASMTTPSGFSHSASMDGHWAAGAVKRAFGCAALRRSEEHTSELQSLMRISYAVFCLKTKKTYTQLTQDKKQTQTEDQEYT